MIKASCAISDVRAKCNGSPEENTQLSLGATDSLTEEERHDTSNVMLMYIYRERETASWGRCSEFITKSFLK